MMKILPLALALGLAGCAAKQAEPVEWVPVVTVAPRPLLAPECYAADPPIPALVPADRALGATGLDALKDSQRLEADRALLVKRRRVCRASLVANFGAPESKRAARPGK